MSQFMLTPEARHLVKIADLDALESRERAGIDEAEISSAYQDIFEALDCRPGIEDRITMAWGERYLTWATSFVDRDGYPFLMTDWAKRMVELALASGATELAKKTVDAILCSCAPLEKERRWWQKQRSHLRQLSD